MEPNKSEQELKKLIAQALSTSPSETIVVKVFGRLKVLGVENLNDLSLVSEKDLLPLQGEGFSVIQIRKVSRAFEAFEGNYCNPFFQFCLLVF